MVVNNSIPAKNNPIRYESMLKRTEYYAVLKFFTQKYSPKAEYQKQLTNIYASVFEVLPDIKPSKNISGLFRFRHYLLMDILFINAFDDEKKARRICKYYLTLFHQHFQNRINELFELLYSDRTVDFSSTSDSYLKLWKENKLFYEKPLSTVVFTATMSSGKSMLVNALVGKEVSKSQNLSCTAKIHQIFSKPFEDGFVAEEDNLLSLDATQNDLMNDDPANSDDVLNVFTHFNIINTNENRLCFVDTPGVNSSFNEKHKEITDGFLNSAKFDTLVYVINACYNGTDDDQKYLSSLAQKYREKRFIFAVNMFDKYGKDDSIGETIERIKNDIGKTEIRDFFICPVSAYAALLAKKTEFTEDEEDDFSSLYIKLKKEEYNLSKFYDKKTAEQSVNYIKSAENKYNKKRRELFVNSGVYGLEIQLSKGDRT